MRHTLPWQSPLELALAFAGQPLVLLYSGVQAGYSGDVSLLACGLEEEITGDNFGILENKLREGSEAFVPAWFGYLSYALRHEVEELPRLVPGSIPAAPLWFGRFKYVFHFDHAAQELTCISQSPPSIPAAAPAFALPEVADLHSNMTKAQYFSHVEHIIAQIHAGALYQANLTRKFHGRFNSAPDSFALFERLCAVSPAPYSAYLRLPDGLSVLSSSPERFLSMDAQGRVTVRPIKGSAGRLPDVAADAAAARALQASAKDRAENLMIVDLMRNDLSRACVPGSVKVERLAELTTHATVHHLSSTISGQRREGAATLDVVKACFPPGSMTGAPKLAAMRLCDRLEGQERGIYSGALGWFVGDGSCDLSVVIRTLLVKEDRFEFQVGGGIVADSTPAGEWAETIVKARGICAALQINPEKLTLI